MLCIVEMRVVVVVVSVVGVVVVVVVLKECISNREGYTMSIR
jgi:hypothetical protein